MCARLFTPWRVDENNCRQSHGDAGQGASEKGAGNHLPSDRAWVLQQDREAACRDHEQAQACGFDQILWPVTASGRDRARAPGSAYGPRLGTFLIVSDPPAPADATFLTYGVAIRRVALDAAIQRYQSGDGPHILVSALQSRDADYYVATWRRGRDQLPRGGTGTFKLHRRRGGSPSTPPD